LSDGSRKAGEDMQKARESIVERAEMSVTHINETNESVQGSKEKKLFRMELAPSNTLFLYLPTFASFGSQYAETPTFSIDVIIFDFWKT
jgi:hypothetical protein